MLLSLAWLREFTPYDGTPQALADRLTMLGLEVEDIHDPFAGLAGVVVGRVAAREAHPDADKLSLCTVDVGGPEALCIVCGAPNVAAGQYVPVATIGAVLPNGMAIKKSKIRGQASHGMICSESELGLAEESSGIMVLSGQPAPGTPLTEALGLDTCVLDVSITPNRADCLSVLGLARETAMAFGLPLRLPAVPIIETNPTPDDAARAVAIEIADPALCPVYRGRRIKNIAVGKSPDWLRYRLLAVGQRPISNVVDVTNYVLFELGQPMHAFDRDILAGNLVRVAPAGDGMKFTTLDGQERLLTSRDLLIWDAEKPVGLAGVMGGLNSEMTGRSTEVFLECAVFDPATIRKTARRLGIPSEASYRFERGVDQVGSAYAMDRAVSLIQQTAGGQVLSGVAVAEPRPFAAPKLRFRRERAERLLGVPLEDDFCRRTLSALGCAVTPGGGEDAVLPPPYRLDLAREADLIEEVGRVYGLDRIAPILPTISRQLAEGAATESVHAFWSRVRAWGVGAGLNEAVNYSFVGHADLDQLCLEAVCRVSVANPLSEDQNVMRPELAPGILQTVRVNISRGNPDLRLFEVAKVFHADPDSETGCREPARLALALHGNRNPEGWPYPVEAAGYEDIKGLVENLLAAFRLSGAQYGLARDESPWLTPRVEVTLGGRDFGYIGRVTPEIADAFHARRELWIAELSLDLLAELAAAATVAFTPLPVYPPVRRDITVIAPAALAAGDVLAAITAKKSPLLRDVFLADLFTPEGGLERNLTFRLTYRHDARTLTDKDADKEREALVRHLTGILPVRFA